jgi:LysM repeat protein
MSDKNNPPHTIKKGETLWKLTHGDKDAIEATAALNHISNPDKIYAGQKISVIDEKTADAIKDLGDILKKDGVKPVSENAPNAVQGTGEQRQR